MEFKEFVTIFPFFYSLRQRDLGWGGQSLQKLEHKSNIFISEKMNTS